jgi:hypothetical protein
MADPDELILVFDWASQEEAEKFVNAKLASRPAVAESKRADGSSAFVNEFYDELPWLKS